MRVAECLGTVAGGTGMVGAFQQHVPTPRMWTFRIGWMSVMPSPQLALRIMLSRQRSESLMWQLSSSSVVLLRTRIAESSSQTSRAPRLARCLAGSTTRQPRAAASIAWLIRSTSVP